jgi:hypothetical protein
MSEFYCKEDSDMRYQMFKHRFDNTPVAKVAMLGKIHFAWCKRDENGDWEVGEDYLHTGYAEAHTSIETLEDARRDHFDLDYEKNYYDDHYIMIVCTYYFGSSEKQIFYMPEHLFLVLSRLRNTSQEGKTYPNDWEDNWPTQPQYAFDELEDIDEWAEHDKIAHHLAMKG